MSSNWDGFNCDKTGRSVPQYSSVIDETSDQLVVHRGQKVFDTERERCRLSRP